MTTFEICVEKSVNGIDRPKFVNQCLIFFTKFHPSKYPKFTCQWLHLLSHRSFIMEIIKPSKEKTVFVTKYFELFIDYMKFIKPLLFIDTPISKEIYNVTLTCILLFTKCFPMYVYLLAFPLLSSIPYEALSLRLPILSVIPTSELPETFSSILELIPKDLLSILEQKQPSQLFELIDKNNVLPLSIVVYLYQNDGLSILTEMILNGTKLQRVLLLNALIDLMRIPNRITERIIDYLSIVIEKKNIEVNELLLTILIERSYGKYVQSGALKALTHLVKTYPLLNEIAKKKSLKIVKFLSDLC